MKIWLPTQIQRIFFSNSGISIHIHLLIQPESVLISFKQGLQRISFRVKTSTKGFLIVSVNFVFYLIIILKSQEVWVKLWWGYREINLLIQGFWKLYLFFPSVLSSIKNYYLCLFFFQSTAAVSQKSSVISSELFQGKSMSCQLIRIFSKELKAHFFVSGPVPVIRSILSINTKALSTQGPIAWRRCWMEFIEERCCWSWKCYSMIFKIKSFDIYCLNKYFIEKEENLKEWKDKMSVSFFTAFREKNLNLTVNLCSNFQWILFFTHFCQFLLRVPLYVQQFIQNFLCSV